MQCQCRTTTPPRFPIHTVFPALRMVITLFKKIHIVGSRAASHWISRGKFITHSRSWQHVPLLKNLHLCCVCGTVYDETWVALERGGERERETGKTMFHSPLLRTPNSFRSRCRISNIRKKRTTNSFHQKRIKHILLSVGFFHDPFVARSGELKKNASAPRTLSFFTLLRIKIILTPSKKGRKETDERDSLLSHRRKIFCWLY